MDIILVMKIWAPMIGRLSFIGGLFIIFLGNPQLEKEKSLNLMQD